jgi:glutamate 5-kinase
MTGGEELTIVFRVEIALLTGSDGKIRPEVMDRLAMAVTNLRNSGKHVLIVSSGAIVLGSEKLGRIAIPETKLEMQAAAAVGQTELISCYQSCFDDYNQIIAQVLITSDIVDYRERMENTRNTFDTLLAMNIIPVINENDPVSTTDIDLDDNYPLALIVAGIAGADMIVVKNDKNGGYLIIPGDNHPAGRVNGEAELVEVINSVHKNMSENSVFAERSFPLTLKDIVFDSNYISCDGYGNE